MCQAEFPADAIRAAAHLDTGSVWEHRNVIGKVVSRALKYRSRTSRTASENSFAGRPPILPGKWLATGIDELAVVRSPAGLRRARMSEALGVGHPCIDLIDDG